MSIEKAVEKYDETEKELAETDADEFKNIPIIKSNSKRGKSILKNRNSELFIDLTKKLSDAPERRRSSFVQRLKNIDGKVITP
jgi:tRNA uridine 5-carbamoylmethylation protein Kti12